jgi:predicted O-methyltransferase YrrM
MEFLPRLTTSRWMQYLRDETWMLVDQYIIQQLLSTSDPLYAHLDNARLRSQGNGLPQIAVTTSQGLFLRMQARLVSAKRILEVGTLGGYSTICLADVAPDVKVTTIEISPQYAQVASRAIEIAQMKNRVDILVGNAADVLKDIRQEIRSGRRENFDFVFIDADKANSLVYFEYALEMTRSGACIIVDNVIQDGQIVYDEFASIDTKVQGARRVIEAAGKDPRVTASVVQTVGEKEYDGMLICCVK